MARLWLTACLYAPYLAVLNGPGVGKLLTSVTGRAPMWSKSLKGWTTSERTAGDVLALAEREGYRTQVRDCSCQSLVDLSPPAYGRTRFRPVEPDRNESQPQLDLGLG